MEEVTKIACATCGATIPADARYCPKCGVAVAGPPPSGVTPRPGAPKSSVWPALGVPLAIVVLVVIVWAVLARMPFGGQPRLQTEPAQPATETSVATTETTAPQDSSSTIVESEPPPVQPVPMAPPQNPIVVPAPPTETMPPQTSAVPPAVVPQPVPPPPPAPAPAPVPPSPQPEAEPREISATAAKAILAREIDGRDPYHTPGNCLDIRGGDYSDHGYTFEVVDTCQSQRLGRWRVDAVTRELFEQKADGRYLRP